jgi:hypothetical protein
MRAVGVLLLILIGGCSYMRADAGGLQMQGRPLAIVVLGGLLIATAVDGEPRPLLFSDVGTRAAPQMKPDRAINEQDCTKPIEFSGNLRCR